MKTNMIETLVQLQKAGVKVYLTQDGIEAFARLMKLAQYKEENLMVG